MFYPPFCLCNILSGDVRRAEPCLTAWTWQGGCCGASAVQWGYPYSTYSWMVHVMENPVIFWMILGTTKSKKMNIQRIL